ncbi:uncharacterized protein LOC125543352 [Triticum urartu]|uniref:uncharacterized protein LOC125543352 n=1 Tax=Triticum urartu TaxID=4572 RepID=UPI002043487B|nr:uncharacterized protein LOC125543352 [Triticum urartu]
MTLEGIIDDYFDGYFSEEMIVPVYGTKLDAARCDVVLCRRGASRRHIYPLPPLDVVRYGHRHGKVTTEIPHFNPRIRGGCGGQLVTELKIWFSVNGWLRSSARGGGALRRQLHAFISCFVYYFSLSESIRDSIVSHYQRNYGGVSLGIRSGSNKPRLFGGLFGAPVVDIAGIAKGLGCNTCSELYSIRKFSKN